MRQVARIRLEKELLQIKRNHMNFDVHVSDDEELKWRVSFRGPEGSIYENERFSLSFEFEEDYVRLTQPFTSPEVVFVGKPPVHEHVYSNGFICLSILYDGWKPNMNVTTTVLSISSMLSTAKAKRKPKDDKKVVRETRGQRSKDQTWEFHDAEC